MSEQLLFYIYALQKLCVLQCNFRPFAFLTMKGFQFCECLIYCSGHEKSDNNWPAMRCFFVIVQFSKAFSKTPRLYNVSKKNVRWMKFDQKIIQSKDIAIFKRDTIHAGVGYKRKSISLSE